MANEIINIAVLECADCQLLDEIIAQIRSKFICYADDQTETCRYELEFVSMNVSAKQELDTIIKNSRSTNVYLQIISYELPNEYLEHNVFKNGKWIDKIKERI